MSEYASLRVNNSKELIALLDKLVPALRSEATMAGMIAGANLINSRARSRLQSASAGKSATGYSYYATAFRYENLKGKTPEELGIRLGVYDRKNGYKLRWLEWGTAPRYTYKRKNKLTGESSGKQFRGKITGSHYFFGTVRDSQEEVFRVVSKAVIDSLEKISRKS